jgi:hypothetical protein
LRRGGAMIEYYKVFDAHHKYGNGSKGDLRYRIVFSRDRSRFKNNQDERFTYWSWAYEDPDMERFPCIGQTSYIGRYHQVRKEDMPKKIYDEFMKFLEEKSKEHNVEFKEDL